MILSRFVALSVSLTPQASLLQDKEVGIDKQCYLQFVPTELYEKIEDVRCHRLLLTCC